ncbi:MAG: hypothetical protein WBC91_09145 [Phototrophicaceae bacterium]
MPQLAGNAIWLLPQGDPNAVRIDASTADSRPIMLPAAGREIFVTDEWLWILVEDRLLQIDPVQALIIDEIEVGNANNLSTSDGFLWLLDKDSNDVLKVSLDTLEVSTFSFDFNLGQLYLSDNRLWLTKGNDQLVMADNTRGQVIAQLELPRANEVSGVVDDGVHLWFVISSQGLVQAVRQDDGSLYTRLVICDNVSIPVFDGTNMWFSCSQDQQLLYVPAVFFQFDIEGFERDSFEHTPRVFDDLLWLSIEQGGRIISYDGAQEIERLAPGTPLLPIKNDDRYIWTAVTNPGQLFRITPRQNMFGETRNSATDSLDITGEITNFEIIDDHIWVQVAQTLDFDLPNLYIIDRHTLEVVHEHNIEIVTSTITQIGNDVWVSASGFVDGFIYRLDAKTGNILEAALDIPDTSFGAWSPIPIGDTLWFTAGAPSLGNSGEIFADFLFENDNDNRIGVAAYSMSINNWYDFIELPSLPSRPLADGSVFWFASYEDRIPVIVRTEENLESGIMALDVETRQLYGPYPICEFTSGRYIEGPFVWAGCSSPETTFTLLNRQTLDINRTYDNIGSRPWSPVTIGDYIWFVFQDTNNAVVFNKQTGDYIQEYALGSRPAPPVVFDGDIWVYNTGDGSLQRIATDILPN